MPDFDHDKYRDALTFLSKIAYDEYRHVCFDIPQYQARLLRTYLWLSSLVASLQVGFYFKAISDQIKWHGEACLTGAWFYHTAGVSLFLSLLAFALGVDTLRGRSLSALPLGSFRVLATKAYEMSLDPSSSKLYPTMIRALDEEIERQTPTTSKKGIKLRIMSGLILGSVSISIISVFALFNCWP